MPKQGKCRITFDCDTSSAKTIVAVILDRVSNLQMLELEEVTSKSNGTTRAADWVNRYKDPVLAYFRQRGGEISYQDHGLIATVERAGLKASSASSLIGDMVRLGMLKRCRRGVYRLAD